MIFKITEQDGTSIIEFVTTSRFTLAICDQARAELQALLREGGKKILFDFSGINFIDSTGIGCVIFLFKAARNIGSSLKLCNLAPNVLEIFHLLHLQTLLDLSGTRENSPSEN